MNKNPGANPFATFSTPHNLRTRNQKRRYIRQVIDLHGFNWLVFEVAASGFFTDSYNLFATNVILPSLAFVYWPDDTSSWRETLINCVTLGGSVIGMLVFGYLADRRGRTKLYGIELLIVIISTLVLSVSSTGYGNSESILPWLVVTRFVMGLGIGAEYPLSASICTEWAPTQARARMMTAVVLMQPLGQLFSQLVGLWVLLGYDHMYDLQSCTGPAACANHIDSIWRWVTGAGAIPAVVAIYYRFMIKDPGLYDLDVKDQGQLAIDNTEKLFPRFKSAQLEKVEIPQMQNLDETNKETHHVTSDQDEIRPAPFNMPRGGEELYKGSQQLSTTPEESTEDDPPLPRQFSREDIREYFWEEGNWRSLLGTSICWFMLDFAFYGLGIGSPRTLAKIWTFNPSGKRLGSVPSWNPNPALPNATIYEVLRENAIQSLLTVNIANIFGSVLLVMVINYVPRKELHMWSFLWLSVLLFITGGSFFSVFHTDFHAVTIMFVAIINVSFNLGANTLSFTIPAEIFPTRYRCTCHGIAAACGKMGALVVQAILPYIIVDGVKIGDPNSNGLGWIFIIFGFVMALGAPFAWAWIPPLQNTRDEAGGLKLPSKTLEDLGDGVKKLKEHGYPVGFRDRFEPWFHSRRPHSETPPV